MARGTKKKQTVRSYKNPNGYGSVYKLSGERRKPYIVRVSIGWDLVEIDGKLKKKQKYFIIGYTESYEEGNIMLAEYHKRKNAGDIILKNDPSFKEIYESIIDKRIQGKSQSTAYSYAAAFKTLKILHDMPISNIKAITMQNIIDQEYNKGKLHDSLNNLKIVCNMVFENAFQNDLVNKNYASFIHIPKTKKVIDRIPFTKDEIETLEHNKNKPYVDTILIMIYTGIRINELLKTKIADVNLEERYFITGSKTDAGKNRIIPIPKQIYRTFVKYCSKGNDFLISDDGKQMKIYHYRDQIFNKIMKEFAMNHYPHDCRHTYASITDTLGMNKVTRQLILGHKGSDVTDNVYTHKTIKELVTESDMIWSKFC